jgi:hypothetical protein
MCDPRLVGGAPIPGESSKITAPAARVIGSEKSAAEATDNEMINKTAAGNLSIETSGFTPPQGKGEANIRIDIKSTNVNLQS